MAVCSRLTTPPPRPSITGGTANGSVYGAGSLLAAIWLTVLARTTRSSGSATAAAPSAENFNTSRRDTWASIMTYPLARRGSSSAFGQNCRPETG